MPIIENGNTQFTFGGQIGGDVASGSVNGSNLNPVITATVDDDAISVGDTVIITGVFDEIDQFIGISDGDTLHYLGDGVFNGTQGFVFGNAATEGDSTSMIVLYADNISIPADLFAFSDFVHVSGSDNQTLSNTEINCFAEGTLIATPEGETAVEALCVGDPILTADGRTVPVKWVGKQTMIKLFAGHRAQMVRFAAGAIGNHSDLYVTGDHGMALDGYIVNASALVNGESVDWVPLAETPDRVTVYHVETEDHDVILANGAASETYLDMPGRRGFDNFQEYLDLYGAETVIAEQPLPRISSARLLPPHLRVKKVA